MGELLRFHKAQNVAPPQKKEGFIIGMGGKVACWEESNGGKSLKSGIQASVRPELPEESRYVEAGDIELSATTLAWQLRSVRGWKEKHKGHEYGSRYSVLSLTHEMK